MKLTPLIEAESQESDFLLQKTVSDIQSNCSEYISFVRSKKKILYRGLKGPQKNVIEFGAIKKREPVSVRIKLDQWIEDFRAKWYPDIASRQRSIFCHLGVLNNIKSLKSGYGFTYLIFPSNGSKVFQSKIVDDFFYSYYYRNLVLTHPDNIQECEEDFHKYFNAANITYSNLEVGINEVVVEIKKHWALSIKNLSIKNDTTFTQKVLEKLL